MRERLAIPKNEDFILNGCDDDFAKRGGLASPEERPSGPSAFSPTYTREAYFRNALEVLAIRSPRVDAGQLGDVLLRHYGLRGSIKALSSEVEHTAEVILPEGDRLIFKTSSQPAGLDSFRFQAAAIARLADASGFVVPRIRKTLAGSLIFEDDGICGYLQTRTRRKAASGRSGLAGTSLPHWEGAGIAGLGARLFECARHASACSMAHQMLATASGTRRISCLVPGSRPRSRRDGPLH